MSWKKFVGKALRSVFSGLGFLEPPKIPAPAPVLIGSPPPVPEVPKVPDPPAPVQTVVSGVKTVVETPAAAPQEQDKGVAAARNAQRKMLQARAQGNKTVFTGASGLINTPANSATKTLFGS